MMFMTILKWRPEQRADIVQRREDIGEFPLEGTEILGEWTDLQGGRYFRLGKTENPAELAAAGLAVNDICDVEIIPVMGTEEVMDIIREQ